MSVLPFLIYVTHLYTRMANKERFLWRIILERGEGNFTFMSCVFVLEKNLTSMGEIKSPSFRHLDSIVRRASYITVISFNKWCQMCKPSNYWWLVLDFHSQHWNPGELYIITPSYPLISCLYLNILSLLLLSISQTKLTFCSVLFHLLQSLFQCIDHKASKVRNSGIFLESSAFLDPSQLFNCCMLLVVIS